MIQLSYNDFIVWTILSAQSPRQMECQRGHVCAKRNLLLRCVQELSARLPRVFNCCVSLLARRICPVRICVVMIKVIGHSLHNTSRHLSPAGAIKIGDRIFIVYAQKSRKICPNFSSRSDLYLVGDTGHVNDNPTMSRRWLLIINGMSAVWLDPAANRYWVSFSFFCVLLRVLCVSVVEKAQKSSTTETQRTRRRHRDFKLTHYPANKLPR